jgi:hypothetical protein
MFAITYIDSQKIEKNLLVYPENNEQQKAMERCWDIIFKKTNLIVDNLEGNHNDLKINNDDYQYFTKIKPYRI